MPLNRKRCRICISNRNNSCFRTVRKRSIFYGVLVSVNGVCRTDDGSDSIRTGIYTFSKPDRPNSRQRPIIICSGVGDVRILGVRRSQFLHGREPDYWRKPADRLAEEFENWRDGAVPFIDRYSVKVGYSANIVTDFGTDINQFLMSYQIAFR